MDNTQAYYRFSCTRNTSYVAVNAAASRIHTPQDLMILPASDGQVVGAIVVDGGDVVVQVEGYGGLHDAERRPVEAVCPCCPVNGRGGGGPTHNLVAQANGSRAQHLAAFYINRSGGSMKLS